MAIIKKNDVTPERPVIIVLYGTPGSGKTSVATTSKNPLLVDTDRGFDRAVQRVDTLVANKWQDILDAQADMKDYNTIVVDTAKACLDDYLQQYVIDLNYKLKTNTLKRFGQMGDEFKAFVGALRQNGSDIVFVCHDKEVTEGDIVRHSPDCTGQSKDLLLRIADQVGYVSIANGHRTISFEPADNYIGKNVAQIAAQQIPEAGTAEFATFMADIIGKVRTSIQSKSEAQRKANELLARLRKELADVADNESAAKMLEACSGLPQVLKKPFFKELKTELELRGFEYKDKKFILKADADADKQ